MLQILAKKVGMTHSFLENGQILPITLLKIYDNKIIEIIKRGEESNVVKIAFIEEKRVKKINKPLAGYFLKKAIAPHKLIKESIVDKSFLSEVGHSINLEEIFTNNKKVDISSVTKGKGFAGSMKRWNFRGLEASHGVSVSHRSHGSTGQRQDPGKTFKGKKMAGHMGCDRITVKNLNIHNFDNENYLLALKGSVAGNNGSNVIIKIS